MSNRRPTALSTLLPAVALAASLPAGAADVLIANGLAPPEPANVIDDASFAADRVIVRDLGCVLPPSACSGGPVTTVHLVSGADVDEFSLYDGSQGAMFAGATVRRVSLPAGNPDFEMSGGTLTDTTTAVTGVTGGFRMTGGTIVGTLRKGGTIEIAGGSVGEVNVQNSGLGEATVSGGTIVGDLDMANVTSLALSGGTIGGSFFIGQGSTVDMSGGTIVGNATLLGAEGTLSGGEVQGVLNIVFADVRLSGVEVDGTLLVSGNTTVLRGGAMNGDVSTGNDALLVWRGGSVGGTVRPSGTSRIEVVGSDFEVDGSPVPFGDLAAQTGTLSGTLVDGTPIDVPFVQGGGSDGTGTFTGTIRLTSPVPVGGTAAGLLLGALLALGARVRLARRPRA